jgi:hypothetical protein
MKKEEKKSAKKEGKTITIEEVETANTSTASMPSKENISVFVRVRPAKKDLCQWDVYDKHLTDKEANKNYVYG